MCPPRRWLRLLVPVTQMVAGLVAVVMLAPLLLPGAARAAGVIPDQLNLRQSLSIAPPIVHRLRPGLAQTRLSPAALDASVAQLTGLPASQVTAVDACGTPGPGRAACAGEVLVRRAGHGLIHPRALRRATFTQVFPRRAGPARGAAPAAATASPTPQTTPQATTPQTAPATGTTPPSPGTPAYLQQAYDLAYLSQTAGAGDTVAIVDAGGDPNAASDLATYRSTYGLPPCTPANGCLTQVNQAGAGSPLPPSAGSSWESEISLDLDAVSALCPNCHILLVEANDDYTSNLDAGVATAISLGANQVSDSWSGPSASPTGTGSFPGASVLAAAGDHGYPGAGTDNYPAAFPGVTAVGATTLSGASSASSLRGYTETAWSLNSSGSGWGGGSGCDLNEAKPSFQTDPGCAGRAYVDVSADGNPETGLRIYDSGDGGWLVYGGTSLATPLVAAFEALTGVNGTTPAWAYSDAAALNDPVSGSTGSCATNITYICNAQTGYDGPTGAGSISGDIVAGAPGIGGPAIGDGTTNSYTAATTGTSATLSGGVYPNGLDTTAVWQYGTTNAYGEQTAPEDAGSGIAPAGAGATLTGLLPATTYHYRLVASNADGTSYGYDETFTTPVQANAPPQNTAAPSITGQALQGQVLSAQTGTWAPANPSFGYEWDRSTDGGQTWTAIAGATASTYAVADGDLGDELRVQVAATDSNGSSTAASAAVGPVGSGAPAPMTAPIINGSPEQGQQLSAVSSWSPTGSSYTYQWQRSPDGTTWSDISGATGSSYTTTAGDLGDTIRVTIAATNGYGQGTAASQPVGPIGASAPLNTTPPALSGSPQRTMTLTTGSGAWSGANLTYTYAWQRSADGGATWTDIENADAPTYILAVGDEGDLVRALVTATNAFGSTSAPTAPTSAVAPDPPANTVAPGLTGSARRGATLTAASGSWSGPDLAYSYQWQRDSGEGFTDIPQATNLTYVLSGADEGASVRVVVTATNVDQSISQASPATATVMSDPPVNTALPAITGADQRGTTLTAAVGTWAGTGNTYAYQWERSADGGTTWSAIPQAVGSTYTPTAADESDVLQVLISASNPDGTAQVASPATAPVAGAPPLDALAPTVSATAARGQAISATLGGWSGVGNAYVEQWQRSADGGTTWTAINGATGTSYTPVVADEGDELRLLVTAQNVDGTTSAPSPATAVVQAMPPVNSGLPTLTGTPQRSSNLLATVGTWSGNGNVYSCQWQRSADGGATWTNINGATGFTYAVAVADEGDELRALITTVNPDGTVAAASPPTASATGAPALNLSPPTVTGSATRGLTLSSGQGLWSGIGNTYAYQWQRSADGTTWTNIAGATAFSYTLTVADEGDEVRLLVTATNPDGPVSAASGPTAAVASAAPVDAAAPALAAGSVARGVAIAGVPGTWGGVGNAYAYQWQRSADGGTTWTAITGATAAGYTPVAADEGDELRLLVTATNPDGSAAVASPASSPVLSSPPVLTSPPAVTGTALRGQTLSATAGTWLGENNAYSYQWQRSTDGGTTWTAISGATGSTYALGTADENSALRLLVTAVNPDATVSQASAATAVVPAAPPVNTAAPSVSGTAQRGNLLTATPGTWGGIGNSLAYQWQRSPDATTWTNIPGATTATYTLSTGDEGSYVRVLVTASNPDATVTAASPATAPVRSAPPVDTVAPAFTGIAQRGQSLSSSDGGWAGTDNVITRQWQRSADGTTWTDIPSATNPIYTLTAGDEGDVVRLLVTAINPDGSATAASPASLTVSASPPVNQALPVVTGTAVRAGTLVTTSGSWGGAGDGLTYAWQRSSDAGTTWTAIPGATAPSHVLTPADEGDVVRSVITATNADGTVSAASAPSPVITATPPVSTRAPAVQGIARQGTTLITDGGGWSPADVSLTYVWQRGDPTNGFQAIPGATASTYTVTAADIGEMIRVLVTGTDPDGTLTETSVPTTAVGRPPVNLVAPAAPSGALIQGQTLTPDTGTWDSPATFTYNWLRCPADATAVDARCTSVGGSSSYTLGLADIGMQMAVAVTATSSGGVSTADSALTSPIAGALLSNTAPPSISGNPQIPNTLNANPGSWTVPLTSVMYSWERCDADGTSNCSTVASDTAHYTLTATDAGHAIVLLVAASSPGRTATAQSPALVVSAQPVPEATVLPVVTGHPERTFVLAASGGSWTNNPTSLSYSWERCDATGQNCQPIPGAGSSTYQLTAGDEGHELTVQVTAANVSGVGTALAIPTGVVSPLLARLTQAPQLSSATVQQGVPVSVGGAGWQTSAQTTYADTWERCNPDGSSCQTIPGASTTTYVPVAADVGHALVAVVTATDVDGSVPGDTAASSPVLPAPPRWRALPSIAAPGSQVGASVTATPGTWSGGPVPTQDSVEIMRCTSVCVPTGATSSYTIAAGDVGAILRVRETATDAGGSTVVWSAGDVGPVVSNASGAAVLSAGARLLRTSDGQPLASVALTPAAVVSADVVRAHPAAVHRLRGRQVSIRRFRRVQGALRVWVCAVHATSAAAPPLCTRQFTVRGAGLRIALPAALAGPVRVVVVRTGARVRRARATSR